MRYWGMLALPMAACGICTIFEGCSSDPPASTSPIDAATADVGDVDASPDTGPAERGTFGAKCATDSECAEGMFCLGPSSGRDHWAASGICTMACDDDNACAKREPGAQCWSVNRETICLASCTLGGKSAGPSTPLDPTKCRGRSDVGCYKPTNERAPFCMPSCNDDVACGPGAKCDLGSGLCARTTAGSAADIGKGYERDGGTAVPCSTTFRRIDTSTDVLFCSANCVLGVVPSCGWSGTGKANAGCIFAPAGAHAGDLGYCAELCDCDSDCRAPLECHTLDPVLATAYGRAGVCGGTRPLVTKCADAGTD